MKTYLIKEIFGPTIQGEGSRAGTVVKFLRFTGCNRWSGKEADRKKAVCWFCDTDFLGGTRMTDIDIVNHLDALGPVKTVVISGGEPTLQIDEPLLKVLTDHGYLLHLETNGSRDIGNLNKYFDHITVSPKQTIEKTKLQYADDLKLLYPQAIDGVNPEAFKNFPSTNKFLQPLADLTGNFDASIKETVAFLVENPTWKLSLQTHKIIGVQ